MSAPAGWDGLLDPGESILWQGRPDGSITVGIGNLALAGFGLLFAGFALVWMLMASMAGGGFWMFGLIHFSVGLGLVAGAFLWAPFQRRHTWYTLTDRRAFIATDMPLVGRRLKSYPIDDDTVLDMTHGDLSTIIFHEERRKGRKGSYTVRTGFERIADGPEVYRLMRGVQNDREEA